MNWGSFGHGHALFEKLVIDFIGQRMMCNMMKWTSEACWYATAFSVKYKVSHEDSSLQECSVVFLGKTPGVS